MTKLAKYLKSSLGFVALIVGMLFLQAYCDLALPNYTSKIVNEGIQQKGIEDGVPEKVRPETMENLKLFMDEDQQTLLDENYTQKDDVYVLNDIKEEERAALADALKKPEFILYAISQPELAQSMAATEGSQAAG